MKNLLSIFAEQNFSCKLIYLVSHYFLSKKALEGARPWNRAPISHARHSTGQHPKWCVSVCSPSPPSASWISAIAQNCGQKRHHPSAGSWWWQICPSFMAGTRVLKISYRYGSIEKKCWGMWVDCWYSIFLCCILNKTFQTNTILFHLMNEKFYWGLERILLLSVFWEPQICHKSGEGSTKPKLWPLSFSAFRKPRSCLAHPPFPGRPAALSEETSWTCD